MGFSKDKEPDYKFYAVFDLSKKIDTSLAIRKWVCEKEEEAKKHLKQCSTSFTSELLGSPLTESFEIKVTFKAWKKNPNEVVGRGPRGMRPY